MKKKKIQYRTKKMPVINKHKDVKSHNVKINVLSGNIEKEDLIDEINKTVKNINHLKKMNLNDTKLLNTKIYKDPKNSYMRWSLKESIKNQKKMIKIETQVLKNLKSLYKIW